MTEDETEGKGFRQKLDALEVAMTKFNSATESIEPPMARSLRDQMAAAATRLLDHFRHHSDEELAQEVRARREQRKRFRVVGEDELVRRLFRSEGRGS